MVFGALSVQKALAIGAEANCYARSGFTVSASVGVSSLSLYNKSFAEQYGTLGTLRQSAENSTATESEGESADVDDPILVAGGGLDYNNFLRTWQSNSGVATYLSMGYKGLFGCGQYSYAAQAFIGYSAAFSTAGITEMVAEGPVTFAAADEAEVSTAVVGSENSYRNQVGRLKLSGGMNVGAIFSVGREFSWGNLSLLAGAKATEFRYYYVTADAIQTADFTTADDVTISLAPGFAAYDVVQSEGYLNTYSTQYQKKWSVALTLGFSTQYYIAENLSCGMSFTYDIYAPVKFNPTIEVASRTSDGNQAQIVQNFNCQPNSMSVMFNLTYTFGTPSN